MTGSHFGIVPRRVARLRLPRRALNVLIAIASRANRDRITPPLSRDDIASEVGIDRSKVGLCVRKLKENGVLELVVEGGGRGRANVYRIIPDEEALAPLMNGAAAGPETAIKRGRFWLENGAISGSKRGRRRAPNRKYRDNRTSPSGRTRARGGVFRISIRVSRTPTRFAVTAERRTLTRRLSTELRVRGMGPRRKPGGQPVGPNHYRPVQGLAPEPRHEAQRFRRGVSEMAEG